MKIINFHHSSSSSSSSIIIHIIYYYLHVSRPVLIALKKTPQFQQRSFIPKKQ